MMGYGTGHDVGLMPITEAMSALPLKRTSSDTTGMSTLCQKRTKASSHVFGLRGGPRVWSTCAPFTKPEGVEVVGHRSYATNSQEADHEDHSHQRRAVSDSY